jgi:hypothetical protein
MASDIGIVAVGFTVSVGKMIPKPPEILKRKLRLRNQAGLFLLYLISDKSN